MKYRVKFYFVLLIGILLFGYSANKAYAQYMPVVYDRTYGETVKYQHICPAAKGEVVMVGTDNETTSVNWVKRDGEILYSKVLPAGFVSISNTYYIGDNKVLIVGQGKVKSKGKQSTKTSGRAIVIDNAGNISSDIYVGVGAEGSTLLCGQALKDGNLILAGSVTRLGGTKAGLISKVSSDGKVLYEYIATESGPCIDFDIFGSASESVNAAFTSGETTDAAIVRLDTKGKPLFVTQIPDKGFSIEKVVSDKDGFTFLIGNSPVTGGRIIKLRNEGDIVFNKEIVPGSESAELSHLYLANNGNLLVGGNGGGRCYYSLLRNDGTDLQKYVMKGRISGMGLDPVSGESVVVGFDAERGRGAIIGLAKEGRQIYQKSTDGNFDKVQMNSSGIFLASKSTGRVCMISNFGDLMFDKYAIENVKEPFDNIYFTSNGDILLTGFSRRLVKLGHGLYVSDVKVNKPVNGFTTATFTVTLTGYSLTDQGAPVPVTVEYATKEGTAIEANNFISTKGKLSFVPANDGANRYMIKQDIEIPIKSNDLMEGRKIFEVRLGKISDSYLIKPIGTGVIEDQEVFVKLVATEEGLEGARDVVYELGLFKTNGEPLVNATGSDVLVDGVYGKGTADGLDYDMGVTPRVIIGKGSRTGRFNVKTLSDTRYELPKSVVIDFNKIHAISDANVAFESSLLSCPGIIVDQPAMLSITTLGDHGRMNNVVSGFFRLSLVRASDGVLLTNATGGDITATCGVLPETTAVEGKDFVFTNLHDLRIWGDGNRSAINLNGIVLFNGDQTGSKNLSVGINSVIIPDNAPAVNIDPKGASASFVINE